MPRRLTLSAAVRRSAAVALVAGLAPAAGAQAASVTISQPCQIAGLGLTATLSGFTPGSTVTLSGGPVMRAVTADARGSARVLFSAPALESLAPGSRQFILTAGDDATPSRRAFARYRAANFAFSTARGLRSPRAKRTWTFSGLQPGRPVFGHFRYAGRTRGTRLFGVAKGPCGELKVLAPGIPVAGRINTGRWNIQIDQKRVFSPATRPRLTGSTKVVIVYTS